MTYKRQLFGEHHYDTAVGYVNLANLESDRKNYAKAVEYLDKALEIFKVRC